MTTDNGDMPKDLAARVEKLAFKYWQEDHFLGQSIPGMEQAAYIAGAKYMYAEIYRELRSLKKREAILVEALEFYSEENLQVDCGCDDDGQMIEATKIGPRGGFLKTQPLGTTARDALAKVKATDKTPEGSE